MRIRKPHTLRRQAAQMQRLNPTPLLAKTFHIPNLQFIRQNKNNIRPRRRVDTESKE